MSSKNLINHGPSLEMRDENTTNMELYEYLSSAFEGDMLGYPRFEIRTMHLFLHKNMSILKLQVYLSSFLNAQLYFALQH